MKVLIVFNQPAPYKVNLFTLLAKEIDLTVIFERSACPNRDKLFYSSNVYDFNHIFLKHGSFSEENSCTNEVIKHLKKNKYDLIIMNGYHTITEQMTISYLNRHHIKWVLFINGGLIKKETRFKKWYKTKFISSASYYISPCKEANEYLTYYGAKEENIFLYPNSTFFENNVIDSLPSKEMIDNIKKELNLPKGKIIICPTQFIPRKNNFTLLEVFKNRNENLILIGNGIEKEKYEDYIKENNINNIYVLPYVKPVVLAKYFLASDALITLSKEDIYGHTINEAHAKGLVTISSYKVVAANHLIKNGVNGFVVPPFDKAAINKALDNIDKLNKEACLMSAKENTLEKQAKRIVEIIRGLVK